MAYKDLVQQLYVGFYGRPADKEGLDFWNTELEEADGDFNAIKAEFIDPQEYQVPMDGDDVDFEALVNMFYNNLFGRDAEEEGLAFYVAGLESGDFTIDDIGKRIIDGATDTEAKDATVMANKVAFANYVTEETAGYDFTDEETGELLALLYGIDEDTDMDGLFADFDAWLDEFEPPAPPPAEEGQIFRLTPDSDHGWFAGEEFYGTPNNDTYLARIGQANFEQGNTLGSGDELNGAGGYDTLMAQVTKGAYTGGGNMPIQPMTTNLEAIYLEAINSDMDTTWSDILSWGETLLDAVFDGPMRGPQDIPEMPKNSYVFVSAKEMTGIEELWSWHSDANLVVTNLTTLDSDGVARNTEEITIGMGYTGNNDTNWDESDYHVYFGQNYLLAGQESSSSQANYWLLDQDGEEQFPTEPLLNIDRDGVRFSLNGEAYTVSPADSAALAANTWEEYAQFMRDEIARMVEEEGMTELEGVIVYVDHDLIRQTYNDAGQLVDVSAIVFEDTNGGEFTDLGYTIPEDLSGEFNVFGRFSTESAETFELDVTSTIVLEKVGNGGDGGMLEVGGMDKYYGEGVEAFKVTVKGTGGAVEGNHDQPSSLSSLRSTNNALKKVYVSTAEENLDDPASLTIGNTNTKVVGISEYWTDNDYDQEPYDVLQTNANALKDVQIFDAEDFTGALSVWAALTEDVIPKYLDLQDDANNPGADNVEFDYAMGNNSSLNLALDYTVVAHEDFDLNISAGSGVNDITTGIYGWDGLLAQNDDTMGGLEFWYDNQQDLGNLNIDTASGADTISILGGGDYGINTGSGNDTVYLHNGEDYEIWFGDEVVEIENAAWVLGSTNANYSRAQGTSGLQHDPLYTGGVLFKTTMQVSFLGFEATADIPTAGNGFTASSYHINQAIKNAIQGDRVLKDLLEVEDGPNDTLVIKSKIDGWLTETDDLFFTILNNGTGAGGSYQETDTPATGTVALKELAVALGLTSSASRADVQGALNGLFTDGEYNVEDLNDFLDLALSGNEAMYYNESVINVGSGDNLVVLAIDEEPGFAGAVNNTNTIEFDTTFTKVSIVNFTGAATLSDAEEGNDILDFTYYLKNLTSIGGSEASQVRVDTTIVNAGDVGANTVTLLTFDSTAAATETWDGLGTSQLLNALNAVDAYGGIDDDIDSGTEANLVGDVLHHIVMVENDLNEGEYKVFKLTSVDGTGTDEDLFTDALLLGVIDFGDEVAQADLSIDNFA